MKTLPWRVLDHLLEHGSDYGTRIAEVLGTRSSAVSQALGTLRERGLVVRDGEQPTEANGNPRVLYRAVGDVAHSAAAAAERPEPSAPPPMLAVDLLDRLSDELDLLRFEHSFAGGEVEHLLATNRPIPGL